MSEQLTDWRTDWVGDRGLLFQLEQEPAVNVLILLHRRLEELGTEAAQTGLLQGNGSTLKIFQEDDKNQACYEDWHTHEGMEIVIANIFNPRHARWFSTKWSRPTPAIIPHELAGRVNMKWLADGAHSDSSAYVWPELKRMPEIIFDSHWKPIQAERFTGKSKR